ncbi:glycoside hydrolase family 78 protein [Thozetella sp. PMI_491]|nr:glycoside hydrolase family 78 protein [Thozetella sp. PMI_491]
MASVYVQSVTFEHHPTGFGIGHASPRISWRLAADENTKNWIQDSYEIEIARLDSSETYRVESSESVLVPWPGNALQSREIASVKVRSHGKTTDAAGQVTTMSTEWSSPATVEVALLDKGDWTAKLTTSALASNENETIRPILFRKSFSLPENEGEISKARLYITAHGLYEAFLNGQRIGTEEMAPGWTSYGHRLLYQSFDVKAALASGKPNVFGVEVGEGWFAGRLGMEGRRCFYGSRLACLAQLEVSFASGHVYTLVSDGTWKCHQSGTTRSEIYDGEDYDSREGKQGWNSDPSFDENSWTVTEELEFPPAKLLASDTPPVRTKETVSPIKIFKSKSGKTLVDFGQNLVGRLLVNLPKATSVDGQTVSFSHAEVLERDELGTRPLRGAKPIDRVILSQGQPSQWSPKFTFHGFRYVQVDGWPTEDGMPGQDDIKALVLHSDMTRTGWFSCSDSLVNQLHENVVWSMKGNFLSVPTDCPQRDERLGWTGDIQVFCPSASFLFNTQGFLGSWLDDVSAEQLEDGKNGVPGLVVPDVFGKPPIPPDPQSVWHDVTVLTPWDLYNSSGDVEILRRQYASMKAWVDQGIPRGSNGLWDQNAWQFGDWLDPAAPPAEPAMARTDGILVADAYLVRVLETIVKVSSLLGETEDTERYGKEAASVRKAFGQEYITPSGLLVGDTQTAHALAICFGLYDGKHQVAKSASRLAHLVHADKYRIATGFAGTPLITHALSDTGNYQLAYRMLLEKSCPSWLYPITMGATTIWERWDSMLPDGSINTGQMTSFNHYALGSVANWLHKNVGGISPLEPGWRKIQVRPVPGGTITSAKVEYDSPYGRIECSWEAGEADGTFNMVLVVPPNVEAVVILPSDWNETDTDGMEKGTAIGSGKYQFSCPYRPAAWPPKAELARSTYRLEV